MKFAVFEDIPTASRTLTSFNLAKISSGEGVRIFDDETRQLRLHPPSLQDYTRYEPITFR